MTAPNEWTERIVRLIEDAEVLDEPAELVARAVSRLRVPGIVTDALSGTWVGHPVHPALVVVPTGCWGGALLLDAVGGDRGAARLLVGTGALSALPAALTGMSDWVDTMGAERRVGLVHAALNVTSLALFTVSWWRRGHGARRGRRSALLGGAALGLGAWLGGHLAYARGVGVDTTAFEVLPAEWTDVAAAHEVTGTPMAVDAHGAAVLLVREGGTIRALADRCTHRGAPLHEGDLDDGCITCPWHGSRFRLEDGAVVAGPASRPQQTLAARERDGRVQVRRRREPGTLRVNPVTGAGVR